MLTTIMNNNNRDVLNNDPLTTLRDFQRYLKHFATNGILR